MKSKLMFATLPALLLAAPLALAQGDAQPPAQAPAERPAAEATAPIPAEKVESFADAFSSVRDIQQDYTGRLQQTQNQNEAQALQQAAQAEMISAVEDSGLSVEDYNMIAQRMSQDEALRDRIKNAMQ